MSRQEMIEALGALGFDVSTITDGVPDEVLAQFLAMLEPEPEPEPAAPAPDAAMADMSRADMEAALLGNGHTAEELAAKSDEEIKAMYDAEFPAAPAPAPAPDAAMADMSRDEMIAALAEKGYPPEELAQLSDEDLKVLFDAEFPAAPAEPAPAPAPVTMSEHLRRVRRFSENIVTARIVNQAVSKVRKEFDKKLGIVRKQQSGLEVQARRAHVTKFCEALRDQGKLLPRSFGAVVARLLRADNVRKFSEHGNRTELELQMAELEAGPILTTFTERMRQPNESPDVEKAQVEAHWDAFSEQHLKVGQTKEKFLKAFELLKKTNPKLTAKEFCAGRG